MDFARVFQEVVYENRQSLTTHQNDTHHHSDGDGDGDVICGGCSVTFNCSSASDCGCTLLSIVESSSLE